MPNNQQYRATLSPLINIRSGGYQ
uniref:Uncharacterized protein n=1 Tax=Arundo donax TaxID=35708 RepID=A0A0A9H662_ARUDO